MTELAGRDLFDPQVATDPQIGRDGAAIAYVRVAWFERYRAEGD